MRVEMVSTITQDPYFIITSLTLSSLENLILNISHPPASGRELYIYLVVRPFEYISSTECIPTMVVVIENRAQKGSTGARHAHVRFAIDFT